MNRLLEFYTWVFVSLAKSFDSMSNEFPEALCRAIIVGVTTCVIVYLGVGVIDWYLSLMFLPDIAWPVAWSVLSFLVIRSFYISYRKRKEQEYVV